jgi:hypothetical protein
MATIRSSFPRYGWIGLALIAWQEITVICYHFGAAPQQFWFEAAGWTTPACWWGYILAVDAHLFHRRGESLIQNRRGIFWLQCILSFAFWTWFEGYNVLLDGWKYENLPDYMPIRFAGYIIAFATIMPGMFETTELIQSWGWFDRWKCTPPREGRIPDAWLNLSIALGAAFCFVPAFLGRETGSYLWAFVWCGWVFLLDPINYRRGGPSIFGDWARGDWSRFSQLMCAGLVCGFLWEFWNIWATAKWIYNFPMLRSWKIFEMPVAGFLGFPPFNVEYFVMFHFIALFLTKEDKLRL